MLHTNPEHNTPSIDVEVAVPITGRMKKVYEHPQFRLRTLPGIDQMASTLHQGPRTGLANTYATLYSYIISTKYRVSGPNREVLLQSPGPSSSDQNFIEVQVPVEPAAPITIREKESKVKPEFVERDAMLVVGPLYQGKNPNNEIKTMWETEYNTRYKEIKGIDDTRCYGVCFMDSNLPEGEFKYIAGMEVGSPDDIPEGMGLIEVPAQKYVVFTHKGPVENLGKTYHDINQKWLPEWGLERADGPELEEYDDDFPASFRILIPVK